MFLESFDSFAKSSSLWRSSCDLFLFFFPGEMVGRRTFREYLLLLRNVLKFLVIRI